MLRFGNVFENILTIGVIFGLGYMIYLRMKEKSDDSVFKNLFSKAGDLREKFNIKK